MIYRPIFGNPKFAQTELYSDVRMSKRCDVIIHCVHWLTPIFSDYPSLLNNLHKSPHISGSGASFVNWQEEGWARFHEDRWD